MPMRREVRERRVDTRWVAEVIYPTGATEKITSDWTPSHWAAVAKDRADLVRAAETLAKTTAHRFGFDNIDFIVYQETRRSETVQYEYTATKFDSHHHPVRSDT